MNTSVNNLSSNKLGGLPSLRDSGSIKEPTLQRSESRKSLGGPEGLQANSQSKGELGGSLAPRSNINLLRKNALIQTQKRELNAEAAVVRDGLIKSRDGKNSDDVKASLLNDIHSSPLFQKMQKTNSGNEDAIITMTPPSKEQVPAEATEVPVSGPPTPPPPPPLPVKPSHSSPEEIKLDMDAPPPSDTDSDSETELDLDVHISTAPKNHDTHEEIDVHMEGSPPSDSGSDDERDIDVDVHINAGPGNQGFHEEIQVDERTQRLIRMQEQQEVNSNALTELNVRTQEQAAIRDMITKMAEANRKTVEAAAKAMVDAAPK